MSIILKSLLFYSLFFIVYVQVSVGQSIKGQALDPGRKPVMFVNVLLLSEKDSSLVKGAVTDENGYFVIENAPSGRYLLLCSGVGYKQVYTAVFTWPDQQFSRIFDTLIMETDPKLLNEVSVVAAKPIYEQQIDKLVVNVEKMISAAGGSALDVLDRSPGVVVNRQNTALSMAGKSGVVIMINGKINRLPMEAVMQMLSGMNAGNIEKVELITNPSAKNDAEGDGGIINIILKKESDTGLNGSYNLTAGWGRYEKLNGGLTVNYRSKKLNISGDYSAMRVREWQELKTYSDLVSDGQFTQNRTLRNSVTLRPFHMARLGFEYTITSRTSIGGLLNGFSNKIQNRTQGHQNIYRAGVLDERIILLDEEKNYWQHGMANLNFTHRFDKKQQLILDADFLNYSNSNPHEYTYDYHYPDNNQERSELVQSRKETPIRIWVLKGDYHRDLGEKSKIEAGLKATWMGLHNDVSVVNFLGNGWEKDTSLSRAYDAEDQIMAGYLNLNHALNQSTRVQGGLRYEYSHTEIGSPDTPPIVNLRYGNLFPSLFITHDFSKNNSVQFSYSRRIQRPGYDLLAPWVMFFNPYSFATGNPALLPTISNTFQSSYRFQNSYILTAKFSHDRNALDRFHTRLDSALNRAYITPQNIRSLSTFTLFFSFPIDIFKWWKVQTNLTGTGQRLMTNSEGNEIKLNLVNANIYNSHSFSLPYDFSGELTAIYSSSTLWGTSRVTALGSLNLGLKKKLSGSRGTITLNIRDLLRTTGLRVKTDNLVAGQISGWSQRYEPRVVRLTYSSSFGRRQVKAASERSTGSAEERSRVSGN